MNDERVKRFLRYYWRDLVEFAIDLANLNQVELEAVRLIGIQGNTIEKASEIVFPQVSVNTMQSRWSKARKRLIKAWAGIEWIEMLSQTVEED